MRRTYLVGFLIHCLWRTHTAQLLLMELPKQRPKLTRIGFDSDINALILDYLTTEGYPSAAAKFSKEANLRPQQEEESVKARRQIQHSIHSGKIQEAVDALNELEPQVSQPYLFYCQVPAMIRFELCTTHIAFGSVMRKNTNFSPQYEQQTSFTMLAPCFTYLRC